MEDMGMDMAQEMGRMFDEEIRKTLFSSSQNER